MDYEFPLRGAYAPRPPRDGFAVANVSRSGVVDECLLVWVARASTHAGDYAPRSRISLRSFTTGITKPVQNWQGKFIESCSKIRTTCEPAARTAQWPGRMR